MRAVDQVQNAAKQEKENENPGMEIRDWYQSAGRSWSRSGIPLGLQMPGGPNTFVGEAH